MARAIEKETPPARAAAATAPRNAAATPGASAESTRTIRKGDTLTAILRDHLKSHDAPASNAAVAEAVRETARRNGIANPDLIYPGQRLTLPQVRQPETTVPPPVPRPLSLEMPPPLAPSRVEEPGGSPSPLSRPAHADTLKKAADHESAALRFALGDGAAARSAPARDSASRADLTEKIHAILYEENSAPAGGGSLWSGILDGDGRLSSGYGMRIDPFTGRPAFHEGLDIAAKYGTPIRPYRSGTVTWSGWKSGYGRAVIVRHENGLETLYGHMARTRVKKGDTVDADTSLGVIGSSGRSTGPHLHFEVRRNGQAVNPAPHLKARNLLARK
jgi:murein DD-endopeptidase MepM/ murein hydrolase activator NlpD